MKKAQVTIFIIIGILAIASFSMVQRVREEAMQRQLSSEADLIVQDLMQTTAIKRYVELCLDRLSKDALYFVEHQGGVIFPSQGTSLYQANPRFLSFRLGENYSANITYGITVDRSYMGVESPKYPCGNYGAPPAFCGFIDNLSIFSMDDRRLNRIRFGYDSLNPLCKTDRDCQYNYGVKSGFNSIQEQMEVYVEKNMKYCVNFTSFLEKLNHNVSVPEEPDVAIQFKSGSMQVDMYYPMNVTFQKHSPVTKMLDFQSLIVTDIMAMYSFAYTVVKNEILNLSFSPLMIYAYPGISNYQFQFVHLKDYYRYDDIFRVISPNNFLNGRAEVFQFAIENRPPVLDYIPEMNPPAKNYDIVMMEDNDLVIRPLAKDPDDDELDFFYGGWLAEYNISYVDSEGDYQFPDIYYNGVFTGKKLDDVLLSGTKLNIDLFSSPHQSNIELSDDENSWHNSGFYEETKKDAYVNLKHKNIGPHNFSVIVMDPGFLADYQVVRLMVDDELNADASMSRSIFNELNDRYPDSRFTSVEDPFILDATATEDQIRTGEITYEWIDFSENPSLLVETTNDTFHFPDKSENLYDNITEIDTYRFANFSDNLHFLRLTAKSQGITGISASAQSVVELEVYECIPHRNSRVKIFPYNGEENPYLADHTCCNGGLDDKESNPEWGIVKGTDAVCYSEVVNLRANDEISESDLERYCGKSGVVCDLSAEIPEINVHDLTVRNDVTKLVIKRHCDGNRGNVCLGDFEFDLIVDYDCGDITHDWQTETCSGAENQGGRVTCTNYVFPDSFEKKNSLPKLSYSEESLSESEVPADGHCSNRYWCTSQYYTGTDFSPTDTGNLLVSPGCNQGKCGYVSAQNSFDCSQLNGYDLSPAKYLGIKPLSDLDEFIRGETKKLVVQDDKKIIYTYSCGSNFDYSNSICQKNENSQNLDEFADLILETDYSEWSDNEKLDKNFAILDSLNNIYVDDEFTGVNDLPSQFNDWDQKVCGDNSDEVLREYEVYNANFNSINNFYEQDRSPIDSVAQNGVLACCKNENDCVYKEDDVVTCYKSIGNNAFNSVFFDEGQNKKNIFGFEKSENLHMICKDGKWLYLELLDSD